MAQSVPTLVSSVGLLSIHIVRWVFLGPSKTQAVMKCQHCHLEKVFTYEEDVFPNNINSFNWGAFALWPIWGFGNKMSYTFILGVLVASIVLLILFCSDSFSHKASAMVLIPLVFSAYYGVNGNILSWKKKDWSTADYFTNIQIMWNFIGIVWIIAMFFFISITLFCLDLISYYWGISIR